MPQKGYNLFVKNSVFKSAKNAKNSSGTFISGQKTVKNFKSTLWTSEPIWGAPNELSDVQMICCVKVFWKTQSAEDTLPQWLLSPWSSSAATVARCLQPTDELDGMVLDLLSNCLIGIYKLIMFCRIPCDEF